MSRLNFSICLISTQGLILQMALVCLPSPARSLGLMCCVVEFVDQNTAQSSGLISNSNSSVVLAVDSKRVMENRSSVRIQSKSSYNLALIIADIVHMPGGICGTWPAFWTIGPDWPLNGEIDIIEGVNSVSVNAMTLHTGPGCSISTAGGFSGEVKTSNCWVDAPNQGTNDGCGIDAVETTTYGSGFNSAGGGVYAMEWTAQGITVWQFPRSEIPSDIANGNPVPSSWSASQAKFEGSCNFQSSFQNQSIIVDTTFCGQWAGQQGVWEADPVCSKMASTCSDYVQNNPADFAEAYWQFNSIKVYQLQDGFIGTQTNPVPTSTKISSMAASSIGAYPTSSFQRTLTTFVTLTSSIASSESSSATTDQGLLSVIPVSGASLSNLTVTVAASGRATALIPESPPPTASAQAPVSKFAESSMLRDRADQDSRRSRPPSRHRTVSLVTVVRAMLWDRSKAIVALCRQSRNRRQALVRILRPKLLRASLASDCKF